MHECSKAILRRMHCPAFATRFFVGDGIDIGAGQDSLGHFRQLFPGVRNVRAWDVKDGDAQYLSTIADETFDFAHSSHCLEHLRDPLLALQNWLRVLRPGGHLVVLIPDEDLYEQGVWPSTFNSDHKCSFTIYKRESWSMVSKNVLDLVIAVSDRARAVKVELLHSTFREGMGRVDQTLTPVGECAIEFVLQKHPSGPPCGGNSRNCH